MKREFRFLLFLSVLTIVGCRAMITAEEAQRAVAARGAGIVPVVAQKVSLADYSLKELVDFAMTNRPSMVSAALEVADARLALREIAADAPLVSYMPWTSPHLSASGGYAATSVGKNAGLDLRTDGNASIGLSLSILLYDFGRNQAKAEAQVERVIASEHAFVNAGYAVFEEVSDAYFSLMTQDAMLEVAMTNEMECVLQLQQAQDRLDAGEATLLDVTSARLELSQAKEDVITASNSVVRAGASMMKALGINLANGTRKEVYPAFGQALSVMMRGFPTTTYDAVAAFDMARTNSPAMAIARAELRAASSQVDAAKADLMPSVSASVGIEWVDPLWAWHWGVEVAQSLFEGFKKTTALDRAVVQMNRAAANVDEVEQQLSLEIESAIAVRDDSIKALETARASVANALENLNTVKAHYAEGDASRVDYTVALAKYAQTLGDRVSAFYVGQKAESKLFALTGRLPEYREEEVKEK